MRERSALQDRPWEEDLLHWAKDGTLHGTIPPPADGRRRSTPSDGWCPGWALEMQRRYLADALDASDPVEADQEPGPPT